MSRYHSADLWRRPLKRHVLGPADVYPQDPRQKEDDLSVKHVKEGFDYIAFATQGGVTDEYGKRDNFQVWQKRSLELLGFRPSPVQQIGASLGAIRAKKKEINTLQNSPKKARPVPAGNGFLQLNEAYVCAIKPPVAGASSTSHYQLLEQFLRDLAGTKPLSTVSKRVYVLDRSRRDETLALLCEYQVPFSRACWYLKIQHAYEEAMQESSSSYGVSSGGTLGNAGGGKKGRRQGVGAGSLDPTQDFTLATIRLLKELLEKVALSTAALTSGAVQQQFIASNEVQQFPPPILLPNDAVKLNASDSHGAMAANVLSQQQPVNVFGARAAFPHQLQQQNVFGNMPAPSSSTTNAAGMITVNKTSHAELSAVDLMSPEACALALWTYLSRFMLYLYREGMLDKEQIVWWLLDSTDLPTTTTVSADDTLQYQRQLQLVMPLTHAVINDICAYEPAARRLAHIATTYISESIANADLGAILDFQEAVEQQQNPGDKNSITAEKQEIAADLGSKDLLKPRPPRDLDDLKRTLFKRVVKSAIANGNLRQTETMQTTALRRRELTSAVVLRHLLTCPQHQPILQSLITLLHCVCVQCPSALVWNCIFPIKELSTTTAGAPFSSDTDTTAQQQQLVNTLEHHPLNNSPLDLLFMLPSELPFPVSLLDKQQMQALIRRSETEILKRSLQASSRWSECDIVLMNKSPSELNALKYGIIVDTLERLERHNFLVSNSTNNVDTLFDRIFQESEIFAAFSTKRPDQPPLLWLPTALFDVKSALRWLFVAQPIVLTLIHWAVESRAGVAAGGVSAAPHRPTFAAYLLQRYVDVYAERLIASGAAGFDADQLIAATSTDDPSEIDENFAKITRRRAETVLAQVRLMLHGILHNFLLNYAPLVLVPGQAPATAHRGAAHNVIVLYADLISRGLFSYKRYMKWLVGQGVFAQTPAINYVAVTSATTPVKSTSKQQMHASPVPAAQQPHNFTNLPPSYTSSYSPYHRPPSTPKTPLSNNPMHFQQQQQHHRPVAPTQHQQPASVESLADSQPPSTGGGWASQQSAPAAAGQQATAADCTQTDSHQQSNAMPSEMSSRGGTGLASLRYIAANLAAQATPFAVLSWPSTTMGEADDENSSVLDLAAQLLEVNSSSSSSDESCSVLRGLTQQTLAARNSNNGSAGGGGISHAIRQRTQYYYAVNMPAYCALQNDADGSRTVSNASLAASTVADSLSVTVDADVILTKTKLPAQQMMPTMERNMLLYGAAAASQHYRRHRRKVAKTNQSPPKSASVLQSACDLQRTMCHKLLIDDNFNYVLKRSSAKSATNSEQAQFSLTLPNISGDANNTPATTNTAEPAQPPRASSSFDEVTSNMRQNLAQLPVHERQLVVCRAVDRLLNVCFQQIIANDTPANISSLSMLLLPSAELVIFVFDVLIQLCVDQYFNLRAILQLLRLLPQLDVVIRQKWPRLVDTNGNFAPVSTAATGASPAAAAESDVTVYYRSVFTPYMSTLTLYTLGMLQEYEDLLLASSLNADSPSTPILWDVAFDGLRRTVLKVDDPGDCTACERVVLTYMCELFDACEPLQQKYGTNFSVPAAKLRKTLMAPVRPSKTSGSFKQEIVQYLKKENIKESSKEFKAFTKKLADKPDLRYSLTLATFAFAALAQLNKIYELAELVCEMTSRCNSLSGEWLDALQNLCYAVNVPGMPSSDTNDNGKSASADSAGGNGEGYIKIRREIWGSQGTLMNKVTMYDKLCVLIGMLVCRTCLHLDDFIVNIFVPATVYLFRSYSVTNAAAAAAAAAASANAVTTTSVYHMEQLGARLASYMLVKLMQDDLMGAAVECGEAETNPYTKQFAFRLARAADRGLYHGIRRRLPIKYIVNVLKLVLALIDEQQQRDTAKEQQQLLSSASSSSLLSSSAGKGGREGKGKASSASRMTQVASTGTLPRNDSSQALLGPIEFGEADSVAPTFADENSTTNKFDEAIFGFAATPGTVPPAPAVLGRLLIRELCRQKWIREALVREKAVVWASITGAAAPVEKQQQMLSGDEVGNGTEDEDSVFVANEKLLGPQLMQALQQPSTRLARELLSCMYLQSNETSTLCSYNPTSNFSTSNDETADSPKPGAVLAQPLSSIFDAGFVSTDDRAWLTHLLQRRLDISSCSKIGLNLRLMLEQAKLSSPVQIALAIGSGPEKNVALDTFFRCIVEATSGGGQRTDAVEAAQTPVMPTTGRGGGGSSGTKSNKQSQQQSSQQNLTFASSFDSERACLIAPLIARHPVELQYRLLRYTINLLESCAFSGKSRDRLTRSTVLAGQPAFMAVVYTCIENCNAARAQLAEYDPSLALPKLPTTTSGENDTSSPDLGAVNGGTSEHNWDDYRDQLLRSVHVQLAQFVKDDKVQLVLGGIGAGSTSSTSGIAGLLLSSPADDAAGLRRLVLESIRVRLAIVGRYFGRIVRNTAACDDWAVLFAQLIICGYVDAVQHSDLFTTLYDMLATCMHALQARAFTCSSSTVGAGMFSPDNKLTFYNLLRRIRRELLMAGDKRTSGVEWLKTLLPFFNGTTVQSTLTGPAAAANATQTVSLLGNQASTYEVLITEPMGTGTDNKGNKIPAFAGLKRKNGLQVASKVSINPWDVVGETATQSHQLQQQQPECNPAPLALQWFNAVRVPEKRPSSRELAFRSLMWHSHQARRPNSYYWQVPADCLPSTSNSAGSVAAHIPKKAPSARAAKSEADVAAAADSDDDSDDEEDEADDETDDEDDDEEETDPDMRLLSQIIAANRAAIRNSTLFSDDTDINRKQQPNNSNNDDIVVISDSSLQKNDAANNMLLDENSSSGNQLASVMSQQQQQQQRRPESVSSSISNNIVGGGGGQLVGEGAGVGGSPLSVTSSSIASTATPAASSSKAKGGGRGRKTPAAPAASATATTGGTKRKRKGSTAAAATPTQHAVSATPNPSDERYVESPMLVTVNAGPQQPSVFNRTPSSSTMVRGAAPSPAPQQQQQQQSIPPPQFRNVMAGGSGGGANHMSPNFGNNPSLLSQQQLQAQQQPAQHNYVRADLSRGPLQQQIQSSSSMMIGRGGGMPQHLMQQQPRMHQPQQQPPPPAYYSAGGGQQLDKLDAAPQQSGLMNYSQQQQRMQQPPSNAQNAAALRNYQQQQQLRQQQQHNESQAGHSQLAPPPAYSAGSSAQWTSNATEQQQQQYAAMQRQQQQQQQFAASNEAAPNEMQQQHAPTQSDMIANQQQQQLEFQHQQRLRAPPPPNNSLGSDYVDGASAQRAAQHQQQQQQMQLRMQQQYPQSSVPPFNNSESQQQQYTQQQQQGPPPNLVVTQQQHPRMQQQQQNNVGPSAHQQQQQQQQPVISAQTRLQLREHIAGASRQQQQQQQQQQMMRAASGPVDAYNVQQQQQLQQRRYAAAQQQQMYAEQQQQQSIEQQHQQHYAAQQQSQQHGGGNEQQDLQSNMEYTVVSGGGGGTRTADGSNMYQQQQQQPSQQTQQDFASMQRQRAMAAAVQQQRQQQQQQMLQQRGPSPLLQQQQPQPQQHDGPPPGGGGFLPSQQQQQQRPPRGYYSREQQ